MVFFIAYFGFFPGILVGRHLGALAGSLAWLLTGGLMILVWSEVIEAAAAWPQWLMTRNWLARHGQAPRRLMAFLADARQRGVLRQVGAVYQFRHARLQHRLASYHTPAQN